MKKYISKFIIIFNLCVMIKNVLQKRIEITNNNRIGSRISFTQNSKQVLLESSKPILLKLTDYQIKIISKLFKKDGAFLQEIKKNINNIILPKIQDKLGWSSIRAIKGRVNDWKTVDLKYNSVYHRDRHIFGGTFKKQIKEAFKNFSAVIYFDDSKFSYIEDSIITLSSQLHGSYREIDIPAGTIIIFPSCLIHKAILSEKCGKRRTIVLFDIENPDDNHIEHNIYICPKWTQKPIKILSDKIYEKVALSRLFKNIPYHFRFYKNKKQIQRVHWQITNVIKSNASINKINYNTSFYLIKKDEYPSHINILDYSNTSYYIWQLFKNIVLNWTGKMTFKDGSIQEGIWADNKFKGPIF